MQQLPRGNIFYRRRRDIQFALFERNAELQFKELSNPLNGDAFRVDPHQLTVGARIGRGGGGTIYKGMLGSTPVAIKEIIANMMNPADVREFENEGRMIAIFRHPNILTGFGWCVKDDPDLGQKRRYLVTELAKHGSLRDAIQSAVKMKQVIAGGNTFAQLPFDQTQAVRWALQIATGLRFLHARGYAHRDVKPGNVLIMDGYVAKVGDLGSTRQDVSAESSVELEPASGGRAKRASQN